MSVVFSHSQREPQCYITPNTKVFAMMEYTYVHNLKTYENVLGALGICIKSVGATGLVQSDPKIMTCKSAERVFSHSGLRLTQTLEEKLYLNEPVLSFFSL